MKNGSKKGKSARNGENVGKHDGFFILINLKDNCSKQE